MPTSRTTGVLSAAFALWLLAFPTAQTSTMPVEEVKPGMIGTGRTVFAGSTLEDFKVHILGVLENVIAPNRDLILARLEGGPLAKTGVIAGMSGSPVYIDGRLVGAVSYSLGQFSTEPIAGITPIAEMTDATTMGGSSSQAARPVALGWRPAPEDLFAIWARDLGLVRPGGVPMPSPGMAAAGAAFLRPLTVPLATSGFEPGVLDPLNRAFAAGGFLPMSGQSVSRSVSDDRATLKPGDAVGVSLLTGDFELGATGTVTHVDGSRVYAFGHPLYNLGPTEFPMTTADVQVVLPSLMQSSKLASFGRVVGTLQQDRATAISGTLGPGPKLIPMTIDLQSDRLGPRRFSFGLVRDTTFTPLLAYLAVANVLTGYERATGPASFSIEGTADIDGHGQLAFEDIFTGDQPVGPAAAYIAAPLTQLFKNTAEPVSVERISLTVRASEDARSARIERVWLDTMRPRAGDAVTVLVAMRGPKNEEIVRRIPIAIPPNLRGSLTLLVADAARTSADDRRAQRGDAQRASQIIRGFNRLRRGNRLYVRLTSNEPGAVVAGEPMGGLPPSVLGVLDADRSTGSVSPLDSALRGEWELALDVAVTGSRQITLSLDQTR